MSEYGLQQVRLSVESERPAYLVTSETHYPGWRAYVDGRPQPIYYTNVAFRGFPGARRKAPDSHAVRGAVILVGRRGQRAGMDGLGRAAGDMGPPRPPAAVQPSLTIMA